MPWSGYPETEVTQLEFSEWIFSLKPKREVLIGYSVRVAGGWELFGNGHWVWFTGAVRSYRGAVQIVSQWAEAESLGARNRIWQWVHWRNPLDVDVVAQPYFVLVPPLAPGYLPQMEPLSAKKSLWTIADITSNAITAIGTEWGGGSQGDDGGGDDGDGDDGGGGDHEGGGGRRWRGRTRRHEDARGVAAAQGAACPEGRVEGRLAVSARAGALEARRPARREIIPRRKNPSPAQNLPVGGVPGLENDASPFVVRQREGARRRCYLQCGWPH